MSNSTELSKDRYQEALQALGSQSIVLDAFIVAIKNEDYQLAHDILGLLRSEIAKLEEGSR